MRNADRGSRVRSRRARPCAPRPAPRGGRIGRGLTELGLAHAVLAPLLRTILRNRAGALAGVSPRPLHDIRVAMRRCRALLRLLRKPLRPTGAGAVDRRLARLAAALSDARDMQVWLAFLASPAVRERCAKAPGWAAFLRRQKAAGAARQADLRGILASPLFFETLHALARFVEGELPRLIGSARDRPARPYAARRLSRLYGRLLKDGRLPRDAETERVHEVRKRVRRARYWAEFGQPLFGSPVADLAARLKAHADSLGGLHDMDVYAGRLSSAPARLVRLIEARRGKLARRQERTWRALSSEKMRRRVQDCLAGGGLSPSAAS